LHRKAIVRDHVRVSNGEQPFAWSFVALYGGADHGVAATAMSDNERHKGERMLRRTATVTAALAMAGLIAGCSSSGSGDSKSSGSNAATGTTSTSGSPAASADKSAINIFFINSQGATTGASYPQETTGAKAAADYVNNKLGGADGHPIKLTTCFTNETPASTMTCANKAVAAKPAAITFGTLADDNDVIAITAKAGIPIISNQGYTAQTLTSKDGAYIVSSGGNASVLANSVVMKQNGVKKVAVVYVNVPGVSGGILPAGQTGPGQAGHQVRPVPGRLPVAGPHADRVRDQRQG
jgi:hypothetical protein